MLNRIEINEELDTLIDLVRDDRMHSKSNPSASLEYNIHSLISGIIKNKYYESDYKNITQKLLYEDISYDYVIEQGLSKILECDTF